MVEIQQTGSFL